MLTLGKDKKLKSKKEIEYVFKEGLKLKDGPLLMMCVRTVDSNTKIGVTAKKRNVKLAVNRNKIKRLIREGYRLNQQELKETYNLFFVYLGKEVESFEYFNKKIKQLLVRLNNHNEDEQKTEI